MPPKAGKTKGKAPPKNVEDSSDTRAVETKLSEQMDEDPPSASSDKDSTTEIISGTEKCSVADDSSGTVPEIPDRILPGYNVPEKIIIVYDCCTMDEVTSNFILSGGQVSPSIMLKRGLRFFLWNKYRLDPRCQFALVIINSSSVIWAKDFTNNVESILNAIANVPDCDAEDVLDITKLFELIYSKAPLPSIPSDRNIPPSYVVRVVFTYGRSFTIPNWQESDLVTMLAESPYFTFDAVMMHDTPSAENHCESIFTKLQSVDTKGFAYFFPIARNTAELHESFAKLLSHPLQRPPQSIANYTLCVGNF